MKKIKLFALPALVLLLGASLSSCGEQRSENPDNLPPVKDLGDGEVPEFVDLAEIEADTITLYPKQVIKLTGPENVNWSVNNDLATISEDGTLTAGEKDGSFIVKAESKTNKTIAVQKEFKIHTMSAKELGSKLYSWAEGYNYTIEWTGRFLDDAGNEITREQALKDNGGVEDDAIYVYEDMAIKGNLVKYTQDAFYWKYGLDGYGNEYEGGSYNSPFNGGSVWDYNIVDGKAVQGSPDYFDGWLHLGDYKLIYSSDLSYFMRDEFKVEDSNLSLSEDKSKLLYDASKDQNNITDKSEYNEDYSIPITLWGIADAFYALQFFDYGYDLTATGFIVYDDSGFNGSFIFEGVNIVSGATYDYEMNIEIRDIGTTVIDGIDELIAADKAAMGNEQ